MTFLYLVFRSNSERRQNGFLYEPSVLEYKVYFLFFFFLLRLHVLVPNEKFAWFVAYPRVPPTTLPVFLAPPKSAVRSSLRRLFASCRIVRLSRAFRNKLSIVVRLMKMTGGFRFVFRFRRV